MNPRRASTHPAARGTERTVWLVIAAALVVACGRGGEPGVAEVIVAQTSAGPVFLVVGQAHRWDEEEEELLLASTTLRRIDVATGDDSGRLRIGSATTHCAPAMVDHVWCNSGGEHSVRRLQTMRAIVDNGRLHQASGARFDLDVTRAGLVITPLAHELVFRDLREGGGREYAIHPETLALRPFDRSVEDSVDQLTARDWTATRRVMLGAYRYLLEGQLRRWPIESPDGPGEVLGAHSYGQGGVLIADAFDARDVALGVSGPESLLVFDRFEGESRISRVRTEDGEILWSYVHREARVGASAIADGVLGLVLVDRYAGDLARVGAVVIGLSVETGQVAYRLPI